MAAPTAAQPPRGACLALVSSLSFLLICCIVPTVYYLDVAGAFDGTTPDSVRGLSAALVDDEPADGAQSALFDAQSWRRGMMSTPHFDASRAREMLSGPTNNGPQAYTVC